MDSWDTDLRPRTYIFISNWIQYLKTKNWCPDFHFLSNSFCAAYDRLLHFPLSSFQITVGWESSLKWCSEERNLDKRGILDKKSEKNFWTRPDTRPFVWTRRTRSSIPPLISNHHLRRPPLARHHPLALSQSAKLRFRTVQIQKYWKNNQNIKTSLSSVKFSFASNVDSRLPVFACTTTLIFPSEHIPSTHQLYFKLWKTVLLFNISCSWTFYPAVTFGEV